MISIVEYVLKADDPRVKNFKPWEQKESKGFQSWNQSGAIKQAVLKKPPEGFKLKYV